MTFFPSFAILLAVALGACGGSSGGDSAQPPDDPNTVGPFAVGHIQFTEVDAARGDRPILVDAWYPADEADAEDRPLARYPLAGPIALESVIAKDDPKVRSDAAWPLLIYSHGYQGINLAATDLMEALASHGFVVLAPEHTGNAQASPTDSFDEAAANRVPDVSFLIDQMLARSQDAGDRFHERIDESRIGVLGHSFGGMTAIGMAAGWAGAPADPRVRAIAPMSAVIDGKLQSDEREGPNAGFTEAQLNSITVPVMLMGGTEDINVPIENNAIAYAQIVNAPRVLEVDIIGATHNHFAAICKIGDLLIESGFDQDAWPLLGAEDLVEPYETTCGPDVFPIEEASRLINLYSIAFFRRYLLDEAGYDQYFADPFVDTEPAIEVVSK